MESISIRRQVAAVSAWSIIARIIQQHGGADDFRVIEMHPSGGQADVLGLFRASDADASAYDGGSVHIKLQVVSNFGRRADFAFFVSPKSGVGVRRGHVGEIAQWVL